MVAVSESNSNIRFPQLNDPGTYPYISFEQMRDGSWKREDATPNNETQSFGHRQGTFEEVDNSSGHKHLRTGQTWEYSALGHTSTVDLNHHNKLGGSKVHQITTDLHEEHGQNKSTGNGKDTIHASKGIHYTHATAGITHSSVGDKVSDHNDGNDHHNVSGDKVTFIGGVKYENVNSDHGTIVGGNYDVRALANAQIFANLVIIRSNTTINSYAMMNVYVTSVNQNVVTNAGTSIVETAQANIVMTAPKIFANCDTLYVKDESGTKITESSVTSPAFNVGDPVEFINVSTFTIGYLAVSANGSNGMSGQVLTTNSSGAYWAYSTPEPAGIDTQVQFNNANVLFACSGLTFNYTSNNLNISNTVSANIANINYIIANGGLGNATQILMSGGNTSNLFWANSSSIITSPSGSNTNIQFNDSGVFNGVSSFDFNKTTNTVIIGNSTVNSTVNSTTFSGTSNNTSFVGSTSAANVVSNTQLQSNLVNYQTTAGLSANVATMTANNTSYVGTVTAANVVSNAQLIANLANYFLTAGLSANVVTLTANDTLYVGTVSAANVVSNAQLIANLANYVTTSGAGSYQLNSTLAANVLTMTANNTSFVGSTSAANVVSNAQLIANLANYQTTAGLSSNVATLTSNNSTYFAGQGQAYYANVTSPSFSANISVGSNSYINTSTLFFTDNINNNYFTANSIILSNATFQTTIYKNFLQIQNLSINATAQYHVGQLSFANTGSGNNMIISAGPNVPSIQYWDATGNVIMNTSIISIGNSSVNSSVNSTIFSGTSNNATNLGGTAAASYQLNSTLSANVLTLTSNDTLYVGTVTAANIVSNAQLQSNLANYTNTASLNTSIATYLPNYTGVVNGSIGNFSGNVGIGGNLTVTGNLTLAGTTTFVNSTVITTNDLNIILANNATTNTLANNAGIIIGTSANLIYNSSIPAWQSNIAFIPYSNNINLGNTNHLWNVFANNIVGTLTTVSQPNITANNSSYLGGTAAASYQLNSTLSANVATMTANNSTYFNGQPASYYANVTSPTFTTSITVGNSIVNTFTVSSNLGIFNNLYANGGNGENIKLTTPGSVQGEISALTLYSTFTGTADNGPRRTADILAGFNGNWGGQYLAVGVGYNTTGPNDNANTTTEIVRFTGYGMFIGNVSSNAAFISIGNTTVNSTINSSTFSGTANNATNLGGTSAASYQLNSTLSANVAKLTANNSTYFNGQSASYYANVTSPSFSANISVGSNVYINTTVLFIGNSTVNNSINSTSYNGVSNNSLYLGGTVASSYQLNSTLSANVATMTANNSTYFNGQSASYYANASLFTGAFNGTTINASSYLNVLGQINGNAGIVSTGIDDGGSGGQLRLIDGNYGVIFRNDGSSFYQLFTASGNTTGTWNTLRPYIVNLTSGAVSIDSTGAGVTFGGVVVAGNTTSTSNTFTATSNTGIGVYGISNTFWGGYFTSVTGGAIYGKSSTTTIAVFANNTGTAAIVAYNGNYVGSDRKLKDGIIDSKTGLSTLNNIRVRDYYHKDDPDRIIKQGFIAQELKEVYPNVVHIHKEENDDLLWMVDYSKLTPLLVKAVQDLSTQVDDLSNQLGELKNEIKLLKEKVE